MARSPRAKATPAPGSTSETAGPTVTPATPAQEPPPRAGAAGQDPRSDIDDQFEKFRTHGAEAAEMAADQLDLARELIVEQVKARPLATAAAAVGIGVFLGLLLAGPRR